MSTKQTIAHNDDFHLYFDLMDTQGIFLQLHRTYNHEIYFEAHPDSIIVRIPPRIFKQLTAANPDWDLLDDAWEDPKADE